jgi:hypothetical protein
MPSGAPVAERAETAPSDQAAPPPQGASVAAGTAPSPLGATVGKTASPRGASAAVGETRIWDDWDDDAAEGVQDEAQAERLAEGVVGEPTAEAHAIAARASRTAIAARGPDGRYVIIGEEVHSSLDLNKALHPEGREHLDTHAHQLRNRTKGSRPLEQPKDAIEQRRGCLDTISGDALDSSPDTHGPDNRYIISCDELPPFLDTALVCLHCSHDVYRFAHARWVDVDYFWFRNFAPDARLPGQEVRGYLAFFLQKALHR